MMPTITKNYENVVISTGNIINKEIGQRKSNEELYDGLKVTLHNDPNSESVVVEIDKRHGRVLCATQELNNRLTENRRNEISIGAKIFLNKNSLECINQAVDALLNILNVTHVDNVVLAYHPNVSAVASSNDCGSCPNVSYAANSWSARNGEQGIAELKLLYKGLEKYALKQQIKQLGIADLDTKALAELYNSAEVAPTIAQVNLAACCVVPDELNEFCREHELVLNTHSDPELLLAEEQFSCLAPGYTIDWSLRYQVHVRCRSVLTAKGYIVGASQPSPHNLI
ncbi:glutamate--cysteine ligase regulatory subunit-like [Drosophila hydei]|uniref:GCS light chain n=1 Tax=Drosophila hydei TaxID=7224 RepID=A0A6J1LSR4_DROHY|nr:glutamate--cysteine ligase regulatory subunit-like [Drosophila hydei]